MEDISDPTVGRMDASAQRVVNRAISHARQSHHRLLTNEHVFLAFARVERRIFSSLMRDASLRPRAIVREVRRHLDAIAAERGRDMRVAAATRLLFKLAFHHAARAGRTSIAPIDLLSAVFEESQGVAVTTLRRHGVEPEEFLARIVSWNRAQEQRRANERETASGTAETARRGRSLRPWAGDGAEALAAEILERAAQRVAAEEEDWNRQVEASRRKAGHR